MRTKQWGRKDIYIQNYKRTNADCATKATNKKNGLMKIKRMGTDVVRRRNVYAYVVALLQYAYI